MLAPLEDCCMVDELSSDVEGKKNKKMKDGNKNENRKIKIKMEDRKKSEGPKVSEHQKTSTKPFC